MPFTPFHWGVSILIQSILMFLDPIALFLGSVIPDIEGITALFILPNQNLPLHGPLHSITGAILLGSLLSLFSWIMYSKINISFYLSKIIAREFPPYSFRVSLLSSWFGTLSHIILDSILYPEMDLLYPSGFGNPFVYLLPGTWVYIFCVLCFILGIGILILRFALKKEW